MYFSMPTMRRSRHPLARFLSLLIGVAVMGVLLVFGLVVASVLLVGGGLLLALRQWKVSRNATEPAQADAAHQPTVLEGEFVVIRQHRPITH